MTSPRTTKIHPAEHSESTVALLSQTRTPYYWEFFPVHRTISLFKAVQNSAAKIIFLCSCLDWTPPPNVEHCTTVCNSCCHTGVVFFQITFKIPQFCFCPHLSFNFPSFIYLFMLKQTSHHLFSLLDFCSSFSRPVGSKQLPYWYIFTPLSSLIWKSWIVFLLLKT